MRPQKHPPHCDVFVLEMLPDKFGLPGEATRQQAKIWDDSWVESDSRAQQSRNRLLLQVRKAVSIAAPGTLKGRASGTTFSALS